jgi:hypothetical protein
MTLSEPLVGMTSMEAWERAADCAAHAAEEAADEHARTKLRDSWIRVANN